MDDLEERLRYRLIAAKAARRTDWKNPVKRQAVEDAARECRENGVDVSDLVAPEVGAS